MEYLFKLQNIHKSFGSNEVLEGVDLELKRGRIHCLAGENGSGKSTLIKILSGIYTPDQGTIEQKEKQGTVSKLNPSLAIKWGVQVIYQDFSLFPNLTVSENISLGVFVSDNKNIIDKNVMKANATRVLNMLGLKLDLQEKVEALTVANKQLVAIARALIHDVECLVMDEPTTALSQREIEELFRVIAIFKKKQKAIVFVSHKMREIKTICDDITILRNGKKVAQGEMKDFSDNQIYEYMLGTTLNTKHTNFVNKNNTQNTYIKVENLEGNNIKNVSFSLREGEIVGLVGFLGSGKEDIAKALFGLKKSVVGNIFVGKHHIKTGKDISYYIKYGIGYVPEDRLTEGLCLNASIFNNIQITLFDLYKNIIGWLATKTLQKIAIEKKEDLKIKAVDMALSANTLSGGNQQKIVLAKWLARKVKFLILNGPTVGVDVGAKFYIHEKLRELSLQGVSSLIISDDLNEVASLCHRIILVHEGRLIKEIDQQEINYDSLELELRNLV